MTLDEPHPAERFATDLVTVRGRGRAASIALIATAVQRVFKIAAEVWQNGLIADSQAHRPVTQATLELSDALAQLGAWALLALLVITGVLFLRWLHGAVRLARNLQAEPLSWTPKDAVWSFIIPFVSFARPYRVVRDLHDALAPDNVPAPTVEARVDERAGYRDLAIVAPPTATKLPHASIGAWWACFWIGNLLANIVSRQTPTALDEIATSNSVNALVDGIEIVSAILAMLVVRVVTARLAERFRRVRHNSVDALKSAGIVLAPAP